MENMAWGDEPTDEERQAHIARMDTLHKAAVDAYGEGSRQALEAKEELERLRKAQQETKPLHTRIRGAD